jgi:hypothetical protein
VCNVTWLSLQALESSVLCCIRYVVICCDDILELALEYLSYASQYFTKLKGYK